MIFIFLLEEDSICKNLAKDRKYMADEEISDIKRIIPWVIC